MLGPVCDGAGSCGEVAQQLSCEPYECSQGLCLTACAGDTDCSDGYYCDDSACLPSAPDADILGAPICGMAPLTVHFSLEQTGGPYTNATWDFGNGTRGTGLETTATYNIPGDFDVTVTLTGPGGESAVTASAAVHVDGFVWVNPLPTGDDFEDVHCADETHVYAVTYSGELLELHDDQFVQVDPGVHASEVEVHFHHPAVWGDELGNVFYVDSTGVRYRIDGVWHHQLNPIGTTLHDIWGVSAADVYAVGMSGAVLHFDGETWIQQEGFPNENYRSVFGVDGTLYVGGDSGLLVRLDEDGTPTVVAPGEIGSGLVDLWASSPENLYVVTGNDKVYHFDGASAEELSLYLYGARPTSVWGSGPNDVFLCTDQYETDQPPRVAHFNGSSWSDDVIDALSSLRALCGTSNRTAWVVGDRGEIRHFDGVSWESATLHAEHLDDDIRLAETDEIALSGGDVVVAGHEYHSLGGDQFVANLSSAERAPWRLAASSVAMVAVAGNPAGDVCACSSNGLVLIPAGEETPWSYGRTGCSDLWMSPDGVCHMATPAGLYVYGFDGSENLSLDATVHLVWGTSTSNVWALGSSVVWHYEGSEWTDTAFPADGSAIPPPLVRNDVR